MSSIYYKNQKYTGPTLDLGSGSLTTDNKTIVGAINELDAEVGALTTATVGKFSANMQFTTSELSRYISFNKSGTYSHYLFTYGSGVVGFVITEWATDLAWTDISKTAIIGTLALTFQYKIANGVVVLKITAAGQTGSIGTLVKLDGALANASYSTTEPT